MLCCSRSKSPQKKPDGARPVKGGAKNSAKAPQARKMSLKSTATPEMSDTAIESELSFLRRNYYANTIQATNEPFVAAENIQKSSNSALICHQGDPQRGTAAPADSNKGQLFTFQDKNDSKFSQKSMSTVNLENSGIERLNHTDDHDRSLVHDLDHADVKDDEEDHNEPEFTELLTSTHKKSLKSSMRSPNIITGFLVIKLLLFHLTSCD